MGIFRNKEEDIRISESKGANEISRYTTLKCLLSLSRPHSNFGFIGLMPVINAVSIVNIFLSVKAHYSNMVEDITKYLWHLHQRLGGDAADRLWRGLLSWIHRSDRVGVLNPIFILYLQPPDIIWWEGHWSAPAIRHLKAPASHFVSRIELELKVREVFTIRRPLLGPFLTSTFTFKTP